ncbi:MAG: type II toxin-antitoxin system mRNA interferase toxin, RelE/StbE family [bacterium]|nr:type II toxin-antitoxin system mRNA interferase toxin, RelE/StbE family [bacterium]
MSIVRDRIFIKQMKKLPAPLRRQVRDRVQLLVENSANPLLNDHKLGPPYASFRSINTTGDWRLVYKHIEADTYYLRAVGTHHQLYGT